jgi:hypothetical protein
MIDTTLDFERNLEEKYFSFLLHGLLRANETEPEMKRARDCWLWFGRHLDLAQSVMTSEEKRVIWLGWEYYEKHDQAPGEAILRHMCLCQERHDELFPILDYYKALLSSFPDPLAPEDMDRALSDRIKDYREAAAVAAIRKALHIIPGKYVSPNKRDPKLKGLEDSLAYLRQQMQDGVLVSGGHQVKGGSITDNLSEITDEYRAACELARDGKNIVPFGITRLDQEIGGMYRGNFWGILGFAGQRKSAFLRSILLGAASKGLNCLHIPLESDFSEERMIYAAMHAHHRRFGHRSKITKRKLDECRVTPEEWSFFTKTVLPDFEATVAGNLQCQPPRQYTWGEMKNMIEMFHREKPIDVVGVDYLGLMRVPAGTRDPINAINDAIIEAHTMCASLGIRIITPVQGNRNGYEAAQKAEGKWDKSGILKFSEFERSLDGCVYIYQDEDLQVREEALVGTCKSRRSTDVPPTKVKVEGASGIVRDRTREDIESDAENVDYRRSL